MAPSFIFGGDGAISALANIDPNLHVDIYKAAKDKDAEKAYQPQKKVDKIYGGKSGKRKKISC